jgi:hypothetical protein
MLELRLRKAAFSFTCVHLYALIWARTHSFDNMVEVLVLPTHFFVMEAILLCKIRSKTFFCHQNFIALSRWPSISVLLFKIWYLACREAFIQSAGCLVSWLLFVQNFLHRAKHMGLTRFWFEFVCLCILHVSLFNLIFIIWIHVSKHVLAFYWLLFVLKVFLQGSTNLVRSDTFHNTNPFLLWRGFNWTDLFFRLFKKTLTAGALN